MSRYYKLSGGGNDFLALAEPDERPDPSLIANWCRRGLSAGADGLFVLERIDGGVRMVHFNSDGGRAALCLNGTRCAARLALHLGWSDGRLTVVTDAGPYPATVEGPHEVELEIEAPGDDAQRLELEVDGAVWEAYHLVVGVPHLVLLWNEDMSTAPVDTLGRTLRSHPRLGAEGANVDFVDFPTPGEMLIRSFERGVEGETLACGTGVLAAAAVAGDIASAQLPLEALTKGGFRVSVRPGPTPQRWRMRGDARLLAEGFLHEGASVERAAPDW